MCRGSVADRSHCWSCKATEHSHQSFSQEPRLQLSRTQTYKHRRRHVLGINSLSKLFHRFLNPSYPSSNTLEQFLGRPVIQVETEAVDDRTQLASIMRPLSPSLEHPPVDPLHDAREMMSKLVGKSLGIEEPPVWMFQRSSGRYVRKEVVGDIRRARGRRRRIFRGLRCCRVWIVRFVRKIIRRRRTRRRARGLGERLSRSDRGVVGRRMQGVLGQQRQWRGVEYVVLTTKNSVSMLHCVGNPLGPQLTQLETPSKNR
jgi:hypothetical protein